MGETDQTKLGLLQQNRQGGIACGVAMVALYIGISIGPPMFWCSVAFVSAWIAYSKGYESTGLVLLMAAGASLLFVIGYVSTTMRELTTYLWP
jgi:hypothetical protein